MQPATEAREAERQADAGATRPRRTLTRALAWAAVAVAALGLLGQRWILLGWGAWRFPTATPRARTEIAIAGDLAAYVAAGRDGVEIVDLRGMHRSGLIPPPPPLDRVDDLAVADGLLFLLDATAPGYLTACRVEQGLPACSGLVVPVPVGPFSGVSAAGGLVAVSGGTSQMTLRTYDRAGRFGSAVGTADFGRGQPNVALRADGRFAAISTHLVGPDFALTFVELDERSASVRQLGELALRPAGFTPGGFKPAHFPLVAAWRGDRVYVADGGGLVVVDVSDPRQPRELRRDRQAAPAIDVALAGDELDLLSAGHRPAVRRFRLDGTGLPALVGTWGLPAGAVPAAIARYGPDLLITLHEGGWRRVEPDQFVEPH